MDHILGGVLADVPPLGGYFSPIKIAVALVFLVPWIYFAPWVQKDAQKLNLSGSVWSVSVLLVGAVTLLIWLIQPFFVVGLLIYLLLTGSVYLAYVVQRNSRAQSDEEKVLSFSHIKGVLTHQKPKEVQIVNRLKLYHANGKVVLPPGDDAEPALRETYNLTQDLLYDIVWRRAGEADITPAQAQYRVRYVVDGVVTERPPMGQGHSEAVIQYLKSISGMEAEDRRRPQSGKMAADLAGMQIEMSLRSAGTTGGQRLQIRILQEFIRTQLDTLSMSEDVLSRIREMNQAGKGLIIISGRSGSGVTSTLYSLLRERDAFIKQLETLEAKPAVDVENVTQNAYGESERLSSVLASALRREPDAIMIDQCYDSASARLIAEAAGQRSILLGMQAGDSFMALAKWAKLCGETRLASENLLAVLCQMLMRKLCPNCREEYRPDPAVLSKANLSAQKIERFYRPPTKPLMDDKGNPIACPTCQGSGYLGRTAVFELLEITDEIRHMIAEGANLAQIKAAARKNRMLYLQEQALQKVIEGVTSVQEVIRVSQPDKKP